MEIKILGNNQSILDQYLAEIRDIAIQTDPLRFRDNLTRIGELFAYEMSKEMKFVINDVQTPLGIAKVPKLDQQPVSGNYFTRRISNAQRAASYFDRAENCFISAFRKYTEGGEFEIEFEYMASPALNNKVVILSDPMLASGKSMEIGYEALFSKGKPSYIHLVAIIASKEGVDYITENIKDDNVTLWLGAVDPEMTPKSYIVPGLGDAGDLAFGEKVDSK